MRISRLFRYLIPAIAAVIVVFYAWTGPALGNGGFTVAPAEVETEIDYENGGTAYVYITSDFNGELATGIEGIPLEVQPGIIAVSDEYVNKKVELTFSGADKLKENDYTGKLTFLARTGTNIAYGVKVNIHVTVTGERIDARGIWAIIKDNYVIIVAVLGVVAALAVGVFIGRKTRGRD